MSATPRAADETVAPLASALVRARRTGSGWRVALPNGTASRSVTPLMDRRAFIGTLTGGLLAAPLAAEGQQTGKVPRVGWLSPGSATSDQTFLASFRRPPRTWLGGWAEHRHGVPMGGGEVRAALRPRGRPGPAQG